MSKETDFLLGTTFTLLSQVREYLINLPDPVGIALIEDQYQRLEKAIEQHYYSVEKKDA